VLDARLAWWREHLGGELPALELPLDRPRPPVQTFRGAKLPVALPVELADRLRSFARGRGATLFMALLSGFLTLLHRYTRQTDLVVGTPVAGRSRSELEGLIGLFINNLALRANLAGDPAFTELLRSYTRLQEQARAAAPHAKALLATRAGRRRVTEPLVVRFEHIPVDLLAHQMLGMASCRAVGPLAENALREGYALDAARIACPVRIVWGTEDRLLPWPAAATRYRREWLPQADWVELEEVGHAPQLDVPLETAQLILGVTGG